MKAPQNGSNGGQGTRELQAVARVTLHRAVSPRNPGPLGTCDGGLTGSRSFAETIQVGSPWSRVALIHDWCPYEKRGLWPPTQGGPHGVMGAGAVDAATRSRGEAWSRLCPGLPYWVAALSQGEGAVGSAWSARFLSLVPCGACPPPVRSRPRPRQGRRLPKQRKSSKSLGQAPARCSDIQRAFLA